MYSGTQLGKNFGGREAIMNNPYLSLIESYASLMEKGKAIQLGGFSKPCPRPDVAKDAPKVLVFAPHPDDECLIGALPLRLLREKKLNVINVAVTQGSNKERQAPRLEELKAACNFLGFGLIQTQQNGLEKINPKTRDGDKKHWSSCVETIVGIIKANQPKIIFCPHQGDWNSSHIGTNLLVMDALKEIDPSFSCILIETEFWGANSSPNLMVESSVQDVADIVAAISCHVEEVRRNPYHLRQPAWMEDNARRGGELVGGQGAKAPDFLFATLYRVRRWTNHELVDVYQGGKFASVSEDPGLGLIGK